VSTEEIHDLIIIGGGINGAGIARDAAGRGMSVLLCEQHDLANHTSSASTKLIHGGLRYLEYYEFSLVRKALREREVLLRAAPHIIHPMRFVMPHMATLRPAWLIRMGLFLYDHLGKRELLPASHGIRLRQHPAGQPLRPELNKGFVYSDCWVQDARLVVLNALDAAERGATILTRSRCVRAERDHGQWRVTLHGADGRERAVRGRLLVNAAGPWVRQVLDAAIAHPAALNVRLVKGSHIVVPKLFDHGYSYIFQNPDKRIVFAIPFERDFTLIGTTDVEFAGDPAQAAISPQEIDYLCDSANRYFRQRIAPSDVVWTYSGVRPLYEDDANADPSAVTRDYVLQLDGGDSQAPVLSVFGGKITTYRVLAEEALSKIEQALGRSGRRWTATAPLPGGDIPNADVAGYEQRLRAAYPWLPAPLAHRYANSYGTRAERLLAGANRIEDLGECLGADLYQREVEYLQEQEWAWTAEDILWRRSKLGLRFSAAQQQRLAQRLERRADGGPPQGLRHDA